MSETDGAIDWPALAAIGADFAYIDATRGSERRDPMFATNAEAATQAGLRIGAVHHFSLCRLAGDQATLFNTTVPRSGRMLPPAIALDFSEDCGDRPSRDLVLSELSTFLNQVETHSGKPALLRPSAEFEEMYGLSDAINRTFWLESDYFPPDYAAKPWVMWTANSHRRVTGVGELADWVVVRQ